MSKSNTHELVIDLIEKGNFQAAIKKLNDSPLTKNDADAQALMGLAHFMMEDYRTAVKHYSLAVKNDETNTDWHEMLDLARINNKAEVHIPVPDYYEFQRDKLLEKPLVPEGSLPTDATLPTNPGIFSSLRLWIGHSFGAFITVVINMLTKIYGALRGYRDKIWTNWYRRSLTFGILTLANMREKLNANNLISTYPKESLIGFQPEGQIPPNGVKYYRTADGSWNNLADPKEGAAGTRFPRNVEYEAARPETGERLMTPNPREISRKLLSRKGQMKPVPFLNMLAASWIQFMNHDWISHGEIPQNKFHEVPLAKDDPARKRYWQTKMFIGKTQSDPTRQKSKDEPPVTFINEVTHWWDGSQIYGSDQKTVDRLRSGTDGKLHMNDDETLPLDKNGIEDTGFVRNWWVGLSMLHTLFAREHNAICDHLHKSYPDWDDNRLFNVSRGDQH